MAEVTETYEQFWFKFDEQQADCAPGIKSTQCSNPHTLDHK